jgi:hypothetical protein
MAGEIPNLRVNEAHESLMELLRKAARDEGINGEPDSDVILCYACLKATVTFMFGWDHDGNASAVEIFQVLVNNLAAMINKECESRGRADRINMSMKVLNDVLPPLGKPN